MSTKLSMTRDINGYNAFGLIPTYDIFGCSLTANAAQSFVVPSSNQYWLVVFTYSPGANIWVDFTGAATVPNGTMGSITSVLNPSGRQVKAGTTISFITSDATTPFVCAELQVINNYASLS
jgi:hypothetical protein